MKSKWILILALAVLAARPASAGWTPLQTDFGPYLRIVSTNDDVFGLRLGLFSENKNVAGTSLSFWSDTIDGSGGGLQLALWRNSVKEDFTGIQVSFWNNDTRGTFTGVGISLNNTSRIVHGIVGGFFLGNEEPLMFFNEELTKRNEASTQRVLGAQLGVGAFAEEVIGLQAGCFMSSARDIRGVQIGFCAGVFDERGHDMTRFGFENVYGIQIGGICAASEVRGAQIGALACATDRIHGLQSGAVCYSDSVAGLQMGAVDVASEARGIQLGVINWTQKMSGFQIGVVNRAETLHGLQIGLLNFVSEGSPGFTPLVNARF